MVSKLSIKKKKIIALIITVILAAACFIGAALLHSGEGENIKEAMRDGVLHETNKVNFFGMQVNPAVYSAFTVTAIVIVFGLIVRIFAVPKFAIVPNKFQLLLEEAVGYFDNLAKENSPHRNKFLSVYAFIAGGYITISTLFELLGLQCINTVGKSISLPAPISDINSAISVGCVSYLIILFGGLLGNGLKGAGSALKDFSLPISMSFRLFGALLSGLLVTDLVYSNIKLSIGLPVIVGVLFTCLHALIQTYVLSMLVTIFYGESSEKSIKKEKRVKSK